MRERMRAGSGLVQLVQRDDGRLGHVPGVRDNGLPPSLPPSLSPSLSLSLFSAFSPPDDRPASRDRPERDPAPRRREPAGPGSNRSVTGDTPAMTEGRACQHDRRDEGRGSDADSDPGADGLYVCVCVWGGGTRQVLGQIDGYRREREREGERGGGREEKVIYIYKVIYI